MTVLGADPDELDRLAGFMRGAAERIEQLDHGIRRELDTAKWQGTDADRLRSEWRRAGPPAMRRLRTTLREGSDTLGFQAAAQREASMGRVGAVDMLRHVPQTTDWRTSYARVSVPLVRVNVNGDVMVKTTIVRDALGYLVTVETSGQAGASVGGKGGKNAKGKVPGVDAGAYGEGKETRTYRVYSLKEAQDIARAYEKAVIPNTKELPWLLTPAVAALDMRQDGVAALRKYDDKLENHVIEGSSNGFMKGDLAVGGVKLGGSAGYGGRTDLVSGDSTVFVRAEVEAGAALGAAEGSGKTAIEAGFTFDGDGRPKTLSLTGSLGQQAQVKLPIVNPLSPGAGGEGTFDAQIDLGDDQTREEAGAYLRAVRDGSPANATKHLRRLLDRAAVTVRIEASATVETSVDAGLVAAGLERSEAKTAAVFVRPPGGGWSAAAGSGG